MAIKGVWADGSELQAVPYSVRDNRPTQEDDAGNREADSIVTEGDRRRPSNVLSSTVWLKE